MKNLKSFNALLLAFTFLFGLEACTDEMQDETIQERQSHSITTKALTPIVESKSNPELFENWENITTVKLNGGGSIDVPWNNVPGNSMNIPDKFRFDIKKEDGWKMLYHTLTDQESLEPNYILFYNKMSGIFKAFYYSKEPENNNNFYWVMEANKPSYIISSNNIAQNYERNKFMTTSNVINPSSIADIGNLNVGWNGFSFEIPYNYGEDSDLTISIYGYNEETDTIKLKGEYSGIVNIPKEVTEDDTFFGPLSKFSNIVSSVLKGYSKIPGFIQEKNLNTALKNTANKISNISKFFKSASGFFSKTKIVNVQGTMSGDLELSGTWIMDNEKTYFI